MNNINTTINGSAYLFGKNIDTDQICPGQYLELTDHKQISEHCLEGARKTFAKDFIAGGIIIAEENFGCGSSREHAAISLKTIGVAAVVAKSFGRIFYRNAINMGLTLIECPNAADIVKEGDSVSIDLNNGVLTNLSTGETTTFLPLSDYAKKILSFGGVKNMILAEDNALTH